MWKNYFTIAWRVLKKNRLYTVLNLTGLTLGITSFLLILFFVQDEVSYDRFYPGSDQVYRITTHWGQEAQAQYATAPPPLGNRLQEDIAEVTAVTSVLKWNDFTIQPETGPNKNQVFREENVFYAEPNFFDVFNLTLISGSVDALSDGQSVVITEDMAEKYFGNIPAWEVVGKNLLIGSSSTVLCKIGAVVQNIPAQSHFHFDMLIYQPSIHEEIFLMDNWMWAILHTYVRIPEGQQQMVAAKLQDMVQNHVIPRLEGGQEGTDFSFGLQPVQDIHLNSHLLREHEANSYKSYVYIFSVVAFIVLLLASINFMNLSTAKAAIRSMEVGVRKVLGSRKSQLVSQFLTEAFILVVFSTVLSLVLVELLNGLFNQISGKSLQFNIFQNSWIWGFLPVLIIGLTLVSGFYPAFYLSSFKPLRVIKGQQSIGKNSLNLRSGLVIFQFATSLVLIICTLMVQRQLHFIQQSNVGFDKEQLLIIHNDGEIENHQRQDFKQRLASSTSIQAMSFSTGIPVPGQFQIRTFNLPGSTVEQGMNWYEADADYVPTLQLHLRQGRNFMDLEGGDKHKILMNEKAAHLLGIAENPIGQQIIKNQGNKDEATLEVIGIVNDFNFESFRQEIKPLVIEYMDDYFLRDYISVRLEKGDFQTGITELLAVWKQFEPRVPMNYTFLDEDFQRVYQSEMQMGILIQVLSVISILIACLGLFGLTAYTTQQRSKEIGIRKVLGASMTEIFLLLSKSYVKLILISSLIAVPLALYFVQQWLRDFAYKIPIDFWVFILAGLACFALALFTVFLQSYKSIRMDPIKTLNSE
ncbi:MAG: FtsX-like permease family protein [Anditalea sp.]